MFILAQSDMFKAIYLNSKTKHLRQSIFCLFFVVCLVIKILPSFKHSSFKRGRV